MFACLRAGSVTFRQDCICRKTLTRKVKICGFFTYLKLSSLKTSTKWFGGGTVPDGVTVNCLQAIKNQATFVE